MRVVLFTKEIWDHSDIHHVPVGVMVRGEHEGDAAFETRVKTHFEHMQAEPGWPGAPAGQKLYNRLDRKDIECFGSPSPTSSPSP